MTKPVSLLTILTICLVIIMGGIVYWAVGENQTDKIDNVGSFISGGTAAVAILWLAYSSSIQRRELSVALLALRDSRYLQLRTEVEESLSNDALYVLYRYRMYVSASLSPDQYDKATVDPLLELSESKEIYDWLISLDRGQEPTLSITIHEMSRKVELLRTEIMTLNGQESIRMQIFQSSLIAQVVNKLLSSLKP